MNVKESLLSKCEPVTESGCWLWTASVRQNGYGQVWDGKKAEYAHRASYREFIGPIPNGYVICHKCDVKECVNPAHLFAAEQVDNIADCMRKDRMARVPYEARVEIRELLDAGISATEASRRTGISRSTVRYWGVPSIRSRFRALAR